jgi:hypothetical protein
MGRDISLDELFDTLCLKMHKNHSFIFQLSVYFEVDTIKQDFNIETPLLVYYIEQISKTVI